MTQEIGNACHVLRMQGGAPTYGEHESAGILTGFSSAITHFASGPADPRLVTEDGEKLHGLMHICVHCGAGFWKGE